MTEFQSMLVVKIVVVQFLNAGVFVVAASIAVKYSTFDLGNGIISSIFVIMAMDAVIPNLRILFMTYTEVVSKVKQWLVRKGCIQMTQL